MPFEQGNDLGRKSRLFGDTLRRAIAQEDGKRIRASIEKLLDLAADGERWAVELLAERLDGKAPQAIIGDDEQPVSIMFGWRKSE